MSGHIPVLRDEMLTALNPQPGEVYIDATFGGGGYTRAILERADCRVIGLDRDPEAIERGHEMMRTTDRLTMLHGTFRDLPQLLETTGINHVHGIVFDFGVSSFQLDTPERGFSFRFDSPLDMRMSATGLSAADVVNTFSEKELADIIYTYGEERHSRRIARAIVAQRLLAPFTTTQQLADLIKKIVKKKDHHPATLTFQALRIFVNNELIEIEAALLIAKRILYKGGRLVTVTFHSLEDRIVKTFLRAQARRQASGVSRHLPMMDATPALPAVFKDLYPRGLSPQDAEMRANPRSRSARLRAGVFLGDSTLEGDV